MGEGDGRSLSHSKSAPETITFLIVTAKELRRYTVLAAFGARFSSATAEGMMKLTPAPTQQPLLPLEEIRTLFAFVPALNVRVRKDEAIRSTAAVLTMQARTVAARQGGAIRFG